MLILFCKSGFVYLCSFEVIIGAPVGNGTFEKSGEILEKIINFKTILWPNATKVEQAVSGTSLILNVADKNLNDDRKNKKQ